jgi:tRNA A-37 threonylcarbamoyl transferase component Bud32
VNAPLSEFVEVTVGDTRWRVAPLVRDQLLGPDGLRLDEWLRAGQVRIVKHGPHRSVYAVSLPDLKCHVKHNRVANVRARLREIARMSKAQGECRQAERIAARQVPTVTPLAVGQRIGGPGKGESYLITRSLDGSVPLDAFIERVLPLFDAARQVRIGHRLAVAVGQFLADLHEGGVLHDDLHAGNLLVCLSAADEPRLHLVDLHAVRLRGPLNWRISRANLVVFNRWFIQHAGRTYRLRFWKAYFRARFESCDWPPLTGIDPGRAAIVLARDLEDRTRKSSAAFWLRRDRRCQLNTRHFKRVRARGVVGHVVSDLDAAAVASLLADPDEPFHRPGVTFLKQSRTSTVVEFDLELSGKPQRVVYKRFEVKSRSIPWLSLVRNPPALRSWVAGHGLRERCLSTPRPLAVFHRRHMGLLHQGYLLTLKVPNVVELPHFLDDLRSLASAERRSILRDRIDRVARLVRTMHLRGVSHRDLKGANLLTTPIAADTAPEVCVIDLVGVVVTQRLRRERRVQNLARLNASVGRHSAVSRTDLLRFLRVYLQWGIAGKSAWKDLWREIAQATRAKQERNTRIGRPLH